MSTQACLSDADIERLASGDTAPEGAMVHAQQCPLCKERVRAARDDATFLGRVRTIGSGDLGPQGAPRLPGYRSIGLLSAGGQGRVYRAVQEATQRDVAIKVIQAGQTASARQRLRAQREVEIAARLRHPNIVTVFESRTLSDERIAVVMEYVDGVPLDRWTPPGDTPQRQRAALLHTVALICRAIHHAHLNGVIHRDLKPDNILVTNDSRPVVLDFGVAKAGGLHATMTGDFAGTPAYASPEQASGKPDEVDALTDVYSLGVILYRLLCGEMPYRVEGSIFEMARTIAETRPRSPRTINASVEADLEAIILRAMEKDKRARYQSAAALAEDIERFLSGQPVVARSGSGLYLVRKALVQNKKRVALAGLVALALGTATFTAWRSVARAKESAQRADRLRSEAHAETVRARAVTELLREALPDADPDHPEIEQGIGAGLGRLYYRLESGEFAQEPEVDQALRRLWGSVYTGLGSGKAVSRVEFAEAALRSGLAEARRMHGSEHAEVASTMHELSAVLLVRKRLPEGEAMCRDTLAMREKLLGPASVPCAESRALLARILADRGQSAEAQRQADVALEVFRTLPEAQGDLPIASMQALKARLLLDTAQPWNADQTAQLDALLKDALVRRCRRLPPEDPDLLASLTAAGEFASRAPSSPLAALLARAWSSAPAPLATQLPKDIVLLGLADRGYLNTPRAGRTDALMRFLAAEESLLGIDHPALVSALFVLMRSAEGERLYRVKVDASLRAASILATRYGQDDPRQLVYLEEAASVLALDGDPAPAADLALRSAHIREKDPQSDPLVIADSKRYAAWFLSLSGKNDRAIPLYEEVVASFDRLVGPSHHVSALARAGLAFCKLEAGDVDAADALSESSLQTIAQVSETVHGDQRAHIQFVRAHVLCARARALKSKDLTAAGAIYAQAKALLTPAWEDCYAYFFASLRWRNLCIEDFAEIATAQGDPARAQSWLECKGKLVHMPGQNAPRNATPPQPAATPPPDPAPGAP